MAKTKSSEEKTEDYRELALLVLSFLLEDEDVARVFVDFSDRFFLNLYMETTSILELSDTWLLYVKQVRLLSRCT